MRQKKIKFILSHQTIIWTNAGIFSRLIQTLGTNFSEILIKIHTFSFMKMHLKMSSAKWRQYCLGLNVLRINWDVARKWVGRKRWIWILLHMRLWPHVSGMRGGTKELGNSLQPSPVNHHDSLVFFTMPSQCGIHLYFNTLRPKQNYKIAAILWTIFSNIYFLQYI